MYRYWHITIILCSLISNEVQAQERADIVLLPYCPTDTETDCISTAIRVPDDKLRGNIVGSMMPKDGATFDVESVFFEADVKLDNVSISKKFEARSEGHPCGTDINVAFLGYDPEGRIILLTDKLGEVVIKDPDVQLQSSNARIIFDIRIGEIVSNVMAPTDNRKILAYKFTENAEVFLRMNDECYALPFLQKGYVRKEGLESCGEDTQSYWPNADEGTQAASSRERNIARDALPEYANFYGEYFDRKVRRITGTPYFFVDALDPCS